MVKYCIKNFPLNIKKLSQELTWAI
jgi:hypothetical protein